MKLLIMGPPGVGKGTQAKIIKDKLGIAHISTGELLRQEIAEKTEVGKVAKKYIDQGKLVPDNFLFAIVNERLGQPDCRDGYILDGFPRTLNQANGLEKIMGSFNHSLERAISLYADEDALVERLVKRGEDSGRSDDTSNIIRNRQKIYWPIDFLSVSYYVRSIVTSSRIFSTFYQSLHKRIFICVEAYCSF